MHLVVYGLTFIENIVLSLFLVKLVDANLTRNIKKIITFTVIYSLLTSYTFTWEIYTDIKLIVNVLLHVITVKIVFEMSIPFSMLISLFRAILQTTIESIIVLLIAKIDRIGLFELSSSYTVYIALLLYIAIILITIILSKEGVFFKRVLDINNFNSNFIITIAILILSQIFIVLLGVLGNFDDSKERHMLTYIIVFTTALIMLCLVQVVFRFCKKTEEQMHLMSESVYVSNMQDLITSVRSHRHDHHNQLQVIYGMTKHGQYQELNQYLETLFEDVCVTNNLLNLNHRALASLLQAKLEAARIYNIKFQIDTVEEIPPIKILSYELIQIIGNIIDNAFEAEMAVEKQDKQVLLKLDYLLGSFLIIEIKNRNSYIKGGNLERIFRPGYSTKLNHQGIGLYTVKRILEKYHGHIELISEKGEGTIFRLFIPTSAE